MTDAGRAGSLRLLLVDDDPAIARLLRQILRTNGYLEPIQVTTVTDALAAAAAADVVILDHQLPDGSGIDVIEAIRAQPTQPSVIVVTAHGSESVAAAALRRGADDYLVKDASLTELLPQVLERVRRTRALRDALTAAERELVRAERMAAIGELTITLHHEINNPLMSAMAEVELLLDRTDRLTAEQRESMLAVWESLQRIREIVRRTRELREDATTEYLNGVKMIDLSRRPPPLPASRGTAALLIPDEELARVVRLLLGNAGFRVQRCKTPDEAGTSARSLGTSLVVVLGASGPNTDALGGFRPGEGRHYRLVALAPGEPRAAVEAGADRVVTLPFDPATFVRDILPPDSVIG